MAARKRLMPTPQARADARARLCSRAGALLPHRDALIGAGFHQTVVRNRGLTLYFVRGGYRAKLSWTGFAATAYLFLPGRKTWDDAAHLRVPRVRWGMRPREVTDWALKYFPPIRPTTKARWAYRSKTHPGAAYSVHPNDDPGWGTPKHPGFTVWLDHNLIGWAPTVSDARDLCDEWERKS